jgi:aminoglycoside phosphotransferase (APT) family kinase protein
MASEGNTPVAYSDDRPKLSSRDYDVVHDRLESWLADQIGPGSEPKVSALQIPERNGMSSETVLFDVTHLADGALVTRSCVARIAPEPSAVPVFPAYDLELQFRVMQLVGEHSDVPVPTTLWFEHTGDVVGTPFFVMEKVDGEVPPDVLPYNFGDSWLSDASGDDQARLQRNAVGILAGIHGIDRPASELAFLQLDRPGETALARHHADLLAYHDWVCADLPSPLLDRAFTWLRDHWPADEGPPAVSWGDSRIGNVLWDDFTPTAVLDWEMASIAPREVDLAWLIFIHQFFEDIARNMGLPGMPHFLRMDDVAATYTEVTGYEPIDLEWFIAYSAVRHGVVMRRVTERSVAFGEAEMPDDVDDLILHRGLIEAILDCRYDFHTGHISEAG